MQLNQTCASVVDSSVTVCALLFSGASDNVTAVNMACLVGKEPVADIAVLPKS